MTAQPAWKQIHNDTLLRLHTSLWKQELLYGLHKKREITIKAPSERKRRTLHEDAQTAESRLCWAVMFEIWSDEEREKNQETESQTKVEACEFFLEKSEKKVEK